VSRDPLDDERVYVRLGVAMAKAQLLEVALVRLVEAQRQDLSLSLDDRWAEISAWLDMTAGQLQRLLGLPDALAADVRAAIGRRNRVAHDAWTLYSVASDSRASADTWASWLEGEASMLQKVVTASLSSETAWRNCARVANLSMTPSLRAYGADTFLNP